MGRFTFSLLLFVTVMGIQYAATSPAIASGYDYLTVCLTNCAQCKKMLGSWFEGQLCADACIKFKGKIIPDCEDMQSISPFLTKMD